MIQNKKGFVLDFRNVHSVMTRNRRRGLACVEERDKWTR
jgi:hypothetical protein